MAHLVLVARCSVTVTVMKYVIRDMVDAQMVFSVHQALLEKTVKVRTKLSNVLDNLYQNRNVLFCASFGHGYSTRVITSTVFN